MSQYKLTLILEVPAEHQEVFDKDMVDLSTELLDNTNPKVKVLKVNLDPIDEKEKI